MKNRHVRKFIILFILAVPLQVFSQEPLLDQFEKILTDPQLKAQLLSIVQVGIANAHGENLPLPGNLDPLFQKQIPLFVTAKKNDEVRGCMGTLKPKQSNLGEEIVQNIRKAFLNDPRHRPIQKEEVDSLEIFLTAVGTPIPVRSVKEISTSRDAVMIRHGNKEAILLPGEAKTQRYLLALLKAKAGIKKGESFQLYRLPSVTFSVGLKNL